MKKLFYLYIILILTVIACKDTGGVRSYVEISIEPLQNDPHAGLDIDSMMLPAQQKSADPQTQKMLEDSLAAVPITWTTPSHWKEFKGSGMRLATFTSQEENPITCTIVSLGGAAGGLENNIQRWMRQINLEASEHDLTQFMASIETISSKTGIPIDIIDLTQLQHAHDVSQNSMLAGIIQLDNASVFIKMTGTLEAIHQNENHFRELCRSIQLNNE